MATTFPIGKYTYSVGRLDAMKQLHVMRRLAPVLTRMADGLKDLLANGAERRTSAEALAALEPMVQAIGEMTDADSEYVIATCLSVVTRQETGGTGWQHVWNAAAKAPQYADIDMPTMLQLVWHVLEVNLGGFFAESPAILTAAIRSPQG